MKNIKDVVKKHSKKFSLFILIGIFKAIYVIGLSWLLIDFLNIWSLLSSTIVTISGFFIVYFTYVTTKVIKPAFAKYASTTISFNLAYILLVWLLVDFMGLSGFFSSTIVTGSLFLLRYLFFNKIGLIKYD